MWSRVLEAIGKERRSVDSGDGLRCYVNGQTGCENSSYFANIEAGLHKRKKCIDNGLHRKKRGRHDREKEVESHKDSDPKNVATKMGKIV